MFCIEELNDYPLIAPPGVKDVTRLEPTELGPTPSSIAGDDIGVSIRRLDEHGVKHMIPSESTL